VCTGQRTNTENSLFKETEIMKRQMTGRFRNSEVGNTAVTSFKALSQHLPGITKEIHYSFNLVNQASVLYSKPGFPECKTRGRGALTITLTPWSKQSPS
jgi:hypothetical protein